jgi:DNA polymerase-3 subunit epsilon
MKTLTFDTETTGIDTSTDRVIELCLMGDDERSMVWRLKPKVPISPEAEAVHGISMNDLKDCPKFIEVSEDIRPYFDDADVIIGYNVGFDIAMISEEFERCAITMDFKKKLIIDPLKLWYHFEKRNLESAYERFLGKKMEGAHAAEVDVRAARDVLDAMVEQWSLGDRSWEELADLCEPDRHNFVGITNHFLWDDDGRVIFGFGTHKGDRAFHQKGYLQWMLRGTFPSSVKNSIRAMLDGSLRR